MHTEKDLNERYKYKKCTLNYLDLAKNINLLLNWQSCKDDMAYSDSGILTHFVVTISREDFSFSAYKVNKYHLTLEILWTEICSVAV